MHLPRSTLRAGVETDISRVLAVRGTLATMKRTVLGVNFAVLLAAGCGSVAEEPFAQETQAVNVCDETVPENRYVDGLPAYAQCDATSGSIWSNNGVDTATSSQGNDWVRTQQGGGYQCTEWAYRYMHFRWGVDYRHGDAHEWCDGNLPATLAKNTTPVHGDLIVFERGVCGADATTGHIAVVDTVDAAKAKVTIVEENRAGRRSTDQSCATCFLHAVANDGTSGGAAGAAGVAGAAGRGGGGMAGTPSGGAPASGGGPAFGGRTGSGGSSGGGGSGNAPAGAGGTPSAASGGTPSTTGGAGGTAAGVSGSSSSGGSSAPGAAGRPGASVAGQSSTGTAGGAGAGVAGGGSGGSGEPVADLGLDGDRDGAGCSVSTARGGPSELGVFAALLALFAKRRRVRPRT